jgi:hypothetical protein
LGDDIVFLHDDTLLLRSLEAARLPGLASQPLNPIHDCSLLVRDRVAELLNPLEVIIQHRQGANDRFGRYDDKINACRCVMLQK